MLKLVLIVKMQLLNITITDPDGGVVGGEAIEIKAPNGGNIGGPNI